MARFVDVTLVLFVLVCCVRFIRTFPSGASVEACGTLLPRHLASPRDPSRSPYHVTASASSYGHGYSDPIQVTIDGGIFKGFIIAAIDPKTHKRIGKWLHTEGTQQLPCVAVTHTNAKPKRSVTVYWQPPYSHSGDVVFQASVVKHYAAYFPGLIARVPQKGDERSKEEPSSSHRHVIDFKPETRRRIPLNDIRENIADIHAPSGFFDKFSSY
ncbi:Uncharacterised protein g4764 [Pycnogonum litorale]